MLNAELLEIAEKRVEDLKVMRKEGLVCIDGQFFPSVHYPPITMNPPIEPTTLFKGYTNPKDNLFDIYVHIPFCISYCTYCHYPVRIGYSDSAKDSYLDMIEKEMDLYMKQLELKTIQARTILIGGGTPTFLSPAQLKRFLTSFSSKVDFTSCTQFNYDVDPLTLLGDEGMYRLQILKSFGVNRLTIGIQSFDDTILKTMNRPYTAKDAADAIKRVQKLGFKINIEFIFGFFGQTIDSWVSTIEKAVSFDVEEIQLYRLKIVPYGDHKGQVLKKYTEHANDFVEIEQAVKMKQLAISILAQNGYNENLRRVFSKKPENFSHYANNQCCNLYDQIGFGLSAFSSLRDRFGLNTQFFKSYYSLINEGKLPINRGLVRSKDDQLRWAIILPLKNRDVLKKYYKKITGELPETIFREKINKLKSFDLLQEDDKVLKLTPLGSFFADEVCHQFHQHDYIPFPKNAYNHGKLYPYDDNFDNIG